MIDPEVQREAKRLATQVIILKLAEPSDKYPKGRKRKDIPKALFDAEVVRIAGDEKVIEVAKTIVRKTAPENSN